MEKKLVLPEEARQNLIESFSKIFDKNSDDFKTIKEMSDKELCLTWSVTFD